MEQLTGLLEEVRRARSKCFYLLQVAYTKLKTNIYRHIQIYKHINIWIESPFVQVAVEQLNDYTENKSRV